MHAPFQSCATESLDDFRYIVLHRWGQSIRRGGLSRGEEITNVDWRRSESHAKLEGFMQCCSRFKERTNPTAVAITTATLRIKMGPAPADN